ncbi:MAG TPA: VC0807 family protein [Stellaceae bacterium]|nr:VC0807 family protein [Stellaceae bacterium]
MTHEATLSPPIGVPEQGLVKSFLISAAAPFVAVIALEHLGVGSVGAVALAALIPVGSVVWSFLAQRRVDVIGAAVLVAMAGAIAVSLISGDPRYGIMKAAPAFGLWGIACLLSLPGERPLMFFVARHFSAGGDPAKVAAWNARLASPGFRHSMRVLTLVWGAATLAESVAGVASALFLPMRAALIAEPSVAMVTVAALLAWTTAYARGRETAQPAAVAQPAAARPAEAAQPMAPVAPAPDPAAFHQNWYPVALASEIDGGALVGHDFCGSRVIAYRDPEGRAVVQSAWCPHLGADLSVGSIADGRVRCAFHHWSFDAQGRCAHIPTGDRIPPEARIVNYPTAEQWGLIWAFNGDEPLYPPPAIPDAEPSALELRAFRWGTRTIESYVGISNGVDFQHLRTLHGLNAATPPQVEIGRFGLEYSVDGGNALQHGRITGTNCFSQHLRIAGNDMYMLFAGCQRARQQTTSYYVVGVPKGAGAEARLQGLKDFVDKLIAEDAPVLATIRFRKGVLTPADTHLARFLHYVETFPAVRAAD